MMSPRLPRTLISHARRARRPRLRAGAGIAALACAVVVATAASPIAAGAAGAGGEDPGAAERAASRAWSPFLGDDRAVDVVDPRRVVVRFDDPSLGDWVAARGGLSNVGAPARAAWLKQATSVQQRRIDALAAAGVRFRIEHRYLRVLNGVSIVVQGDGAQLLRAVKGVATVTPVRTIWPAAVDDDGAAGAAAAAGATVASTHTSAGAAATTMRVAVLDSGVEATHRAVAGHVLPALDATEAKAAVGTTIHADAHGTAVAGAVLAGARTAGSSADVSVLPIQVLEQRPARDGVEALLGDSDDLLAGLERTVDPDGRIATDDGAQVAVVASATPYAGFAGSPEDRAAAGADALGTVVVAAAGNDGASGDSVGTIGSLAASRSALAVGAADLRGTVSAAAVHVRGDGVEETFDAAAVLTASEAKLPRGASAVVVVEGGDEVQDYLDAQLRSRATGAVVLVATRDGVSVAKQVRAAADAGALAVLVGSDDAEAAAGTIDARGTDVPAIAIARADARELRDALADGRALTVSFEAERIDNPAFGTVAGFSSSGPRLDGAGRPDVLAPGVGMLVAGDRGAFRHASGTSIAAAWAAGQVAAVRASHPGASTADVRALLLGSAIALGERGDRPGVAVQGAGVLDAKRALAATALVDGGRIDFGSIAPGASVERELVVRGLDGASIDASSVQLDDGGHDLHGAALALRDGTLVLTVPKDHADGHVGGWLVIEDAKLRVPWSATIRDSSAQTVPLRAELSARTLRPVAGPGAFAGSLEVKVGGSGGAGLGLTAVERLEVRLIDARGKDRGAIGGLEQALPGIYTFGITGVDAAGKRLERGVWQLRLRYVPATDPDGAWREGPVATFAMAGTGSAAPRS